MILSVMKTLNGSDIAGFIKQRQAKQVRSLKQAHNIFPKLVIIKTLNDPVISTYVRLKQRYGDDIGVEVELRHVKQDEAIELIAKLNQDPKTHGIIVQLPISDMQQVDEVLNSVKPDKDVDGLALNSNFIPATPTAINWLLDGYNIELKGKKIAIVGAGRLVGGPLVKIYDELKLDYEIYNRSVVDIETKLKKADIVITATGSAGVIKSSMLKNGAVAIDAGVATTDGGFHGDFDDNIYDRRDLIVTPKKGGVGPLTVSALFENLIQASSSDRDAS